MVKLENFPLEEWSETFAQSNSRHNDETMRMYSLHERCSESDGDPCRFLRALTVLGMIKAYNCIFDKCIKRYPKETELEKML